MRLYFETGSRSGFTGEALRDVPQQHTQGKIQLHFISNEEGTQMIS